MTIEAIDLQQFIKRGGKITWNDDLRSFRFRFPSGFDYESLCSSAEEGLMRAQNFLLRAQLEKCFLEKVESGGH